MTDSRSTWRERWAKAPDSPWFGRNFLVAWLLFLFPIYWGSAFIGSIFYLALLIPVLVLWLLANCRLRRYRKAGPRCPDTFRGDL